MNRRAFLGLFRGLAALPFVKLPALPPDSTFYSLLYLDKLDVHSYYLSTSGVLDVLDVSFSQPLSITYKEGDFISVWIDGHLLREGYVRTASKLGFTLVSPFADLR